MSIPPNAPTAPDPSHRAEPRVRDLPLVIQGGMGVAVSGWRLASAVARAGQLGVVSGTALDTVLLRRLQDGDAGGHLRRALATFPIPDLADEVLARYFLPAGRAPGRPYARAPMHTVRGSRIGRALTVLGAYVEVHLAREGHDGSIGINLLTKVQLATLPTLYGAMLAGVEWVLMGAGIPREVPGALDAFATRTPFEMRIDVAGASRGAAPTTVRLDPAELGDDSGGPLQRPAFLPIVASNSLATMMAKRANGSIEGFVVEGPTAGGHNAPPRGGKTFDASGQPVYGDRDVVDLDKLRDLGLPFWLAGGTGSPEGLRAARKRGAAGVQVGTLFAYTRESGLEAGVKDDVVRRTLKGEVTVRTDPRASPTGFPFKVVDVPGSLSEPEVREARERICDLGYLRETYETPSGGLGYRCPSEPVDAYLAKGGAREDTEGRACLCNALTADVGLAQTQKNGEVERPLVTSGDELLALGRFLRTGARNYGAREVVDYLLGA